MGISETYTLIISNSSVILTGIFIFFTILLALSDKIKKLTGISINGDRPSEKAEGLWKHSYFLFLPSIIFLILTILISMYGFVFNTEYFYISLIHLSVILFTVSLFLFLLFMIALYFTLRAS